MFLQIDDDILVNLDYIVSTNCADLPDGSSRLHLYEAGLDAGCSFTLTCANRADALAVIDLIKLNQPTLDVRKFRLS